MVRVHKRHIEISPGVVKDARQDIWNEEEVESVDSTVGKLMTILVETFDELCHFGLYTIKWY